MTSTPKLEKETDKEVFASSDEQRQAVRYKKLQEAEAKRQAELEAEMKERDELRRERAQNRAKRSALSSSSSSSVSALPTTKRNTGYSYGIGPDDISGEGEDSVVKYHNWNEFQEKLDYLEETKAQLRQATREARADGLPTVKNPYASYPAKLGIHCWFKNRGISYNPELNAANTAQSYIAKHKMQAPTLRGKAA
jgi:hypothetical protein